MVSLHNVLKHSYKSKPAGNMNGYELDKSLSNHNQQVYYNPNEKNYYCQSLELIIYAMLGLILCLVLVN